MNRIILKKISVIFFVFGFTLVYTLLADTQINYDTAWTFVYDGGRDSASGSIYWDKFFDVKALPNGSCVCVGFTGYSNFSSFLAILGSSGNIIKNKSFNTTHEKGQFNSQSAHSLVIAKNGDFIIGGERYLSPWVMRLDSAVNVKWMAWYYDSTKGLLGRRLTGGGTINSIRETSRGRIVCVAGDEFPNNGGNLLENYAAYLEFDSAGVLKRSREWDTPLGNKISGFSIDETKDGDFLIAGNQSVFFLDSTGYAKWRANYTFMLDGVGSVMNNIIRAKKLRDGSLMAAGQAYEGNCWNNLQKLYYDAWWSPIEQGGGSHTAWDTAGRQGGDDAIYDFTQLSDGKLVFVGKKSSISELGGVWSFVTDSTGKNILWEKQTNIPYKTSNGQAPVPLSVCATPDGGFTVVGEYACTDDIGGLNAFAAHYKISPVTAVAKIQTSLSNVRSVRYKINGSKVLFSIPSPGLQPGKISIYNAAGKLVTRLSSRTDSYVWDCSRAVSGVYYYQVKSKMFRANGKLMLD
jgi:hypothetical protein